MNKERFEELVQSVDEARLSEFTTELNKLDMSMLQFASVLGKKKNISCTIEKGKKLIIKHKEG